MNVMFWFLYIILALPKFSEQQGMIPFHCIDHHMRQYAENIRNKPPKEPPLSWDADDVFRYEDLDLSQFDADLKEALQRYRLHTYARPWFDAASICWLQGGRLATPVNEAEARTLGHLVDVLAQANVTNTEMRDFMHVGVHNLEKKSYVSTTEGDKATYTPWKAGIVFQPTESTCAVILSNGRYMPQPCTQSLPYVCDMNPSPQKEVIAASSNEKKDEEVYTFMSDDRQHTLHNKPLPWLEAATMCEVEGGRLAIPHGERQAGLLAGHLFSGAHVTPEAQERGLFIGINDMAMEGHWHGTDGPIVDHLWKDGKPGHNRSTNCAAHLSAGQYIPVSCREARPYICELTRLLTENPEYVEVEGKGRYAFHVAAKNWVSAASQCRSENATLAVVNSFEEAVALEKIQKEVAKKFPGFDSSHVFLGMHDIDRTDRWRTFDNKGEYDVGYNAWIGVSGSLIQGKAICVGLRDAKLIILECAKEHMYICEKPWEHANRELVSEENKNL